ncbi:uncharacterized protein PV09_07359 [Verruconis gallopava]|uniref:Heterokaryon incompatibility domain-containing protein n=1 Tax=Verruconis gallopava TaxID=253628 RepID=A0A0D1YJP1_9PEZI|nr:uncharacterized protein PV09_07359 [Verruconis gallopava]KIW01067.1 hypothetical protein PV09_07359 [Verruconis gallopava]
MHVNYADDLNGIQHCKYCRHITLEKLASPEGYLHAPSRSSLVRSAQRCRLCSLLFRKDRSRQASQLCLSLAPFSEDDPQVVLNISHVGAAEPSRNARLSLFLYTDAGDPAANRFDITAKRPLKDTSSETTFDTVRSWLATCVNLHHCSTPLSLKDQEHTPAARLLDLEAFTLPDLDLRLIDNDGEPKQYATLSYCWGNSRAFVTESRSIQRRRSRIDFKSLPKTFRDAIQISRKLKIRYLWIDACCIVQDSESDWQRESAKMGYIYSNSYVTIAADSGIDSSSGCFNVSSSSQELTLESKPFEFRSETSDGQKTSIFLWDPSRGSRRPTPPEIDGSPLSERGWVCQERILSPRILHYTKSQVFWECRQCLLAEDGLRPWSLWSDADTVPGLARNLYGTTSDFDNQDRLLDIWYQNVVSQSYSRRKLTRSKDKLTAISGLAQAFHRHFRSRYIAGLWELDLAYALCWRRRGPVVFPEIYRAPSFSWACIDAVIEWPLRSNMKSAKLNVKSITVKLESADAFGTVSKCSLSILGRLRRAMVTSRRRISARGIDFEWELRTLSNKLLGTAFMDSDDLDDGFEHADCLILDEDNKKHALILQQKSKEHSEYIRIGVAELLGLDEDDEFFCQGHEQSIVLV